MGLVSKPHTFSPNTTALSSEVNDDFDTIYNAFNGSISGANLADGAVTTAKIADSAVTSAKIAAGTIVASDLDADLAKGWTLGLGAPDTVTYNGNRSYDVVYNSSDKTGTTSNGMRLRFTRTVTAPTRCTDLESGSSQYYSKTSPNKLTFTDDYTDGAWIKPESYGAGGILGRRNADVEGWSLSLNANGQLVASSLRIAGNNSVTTSYQSVPLGKWSHVAASTDLSGTSVLLYIDGVLVPSATVITGTITALVQGTTALVVGAEKSAGTNPFDGKIAQAFVATGIISATNLRTLISQGLTSALISTFNIQSAYSFDNSIADLNTTTPNDLTAQGSALATNADSPFGQQADGTTAGTTDYGIVTKTAFSTNTTLTVQVPEGCTIPTSGGVSASAYSSSGKPYGLPTSKTKWRIEALWIVRTTGAATSTGTWYNYNNYATIPVGDWDLGYAASVLVTHAGAGFITAFITLSTANNSQSNIEFTQRTPAISSSSTDNDGFVSSRNPVALAAATPWYLNASPGVSTETVYFGVGTALASTTATQIFADFTLL